MPGPVTPGSRARQSAKTYAHYRDKVLKHPQQYTALKVERYRKGITQIDLAEAVGISPGTLNEYEQRTPIKKIETKIALAKALNVNVSEVFPTCPSK